VLGNLVRDLFEPVLGYVVDALISERIFIFRVTKITLASFETFTAVMFQVEVFWIVTPCSVVVGYRRFGGPCCLHLQVFQVEVFWVVTPCSVVVGYRRFGGLCCLQLQVFQV
jgi:hypothetical protein